MNNSSFAQRAIARGLRMSARHNPCRRRDGRLDHIPIIDPVCTRGLSRAEAGGALHLTPVPMQRTGHSDLSQAADC